MRVLGIETSCDETGVAVYDEDAGLLAHAVYSQVEIHAEFGGVVPELASRDHVRKLVPLTLQAGSSRIECPKLFGEYFPLTQQAGVFDLQLAQALFAISRITAVLVYLGAAPQPGQRCADGKSAQGVNKGRFNHRQVAARMRAV